MQTSAKCIAIATAYLINSASTFCSSSSAQDVNDLSSISKELLQEKIDIVNNTHYVLSEHKWTVGPSELFSIRQIVMDNVFSSPPSANFESVVEKNKQLIDAISHASGQKEIRFLKWDISFFNGMRKFVETYVESNPSLPPETPPPNVRILTDNGNQYLFTDTSIYTYRASQNALIVKPLNQFVDAFPMRLDMLNFIFNIKPNFDVSMWKNFKLSRSSDLITLANSEARTTIAIRIYGKNIFPCYFFVGGERENFMEKTFGSFSEIPSAKGSFVPTLCVAVSKGPSSTANITAFSIESVSQGKLDSGNFPITVPKNTNVHDLSVASPDVIIQQ